MTVDTWTPGMDPDEKAASFVHRWRTTLPGFCTVPEADNQAGEVCFGGALFAVKAGFLVARREWVPVGKYVAKEASRPYQGLAPAGLGDGVMCELAASLVMCLGMMGAGNRLVFVPWTPTTLDVMAADWSVFDRPRG